MPATNNQSSPISILLVEDEPDSRDILGRMLALKLPGIMLQTAEHGEKGLELYRKHRHELVITDINMPVLNGIKMAEEIKGLNPDALIIFITAHNDTDFLLQGIEMGIAHYVLKPVSQHKLFDVINRCLVRINLERQVRAQQQHIRKLSKALERSPNMVVITTRDGTIDYVNQRFSEVTGFAATEVIGLNVRMLHPLEWSGDRFEELWETISNGGDWRGELQSRKKGDETYWEAVAISPIIDEQGQITNFVADKEDITARRQAEAEIELLNTNLAERAAELEALNIELEAFSYSVSHDLRSPLTAINGYSELLLEKYADMLGPEGLDYLREITGEAMRMNRLIGTLLDFSRLKRQELHCRDVDLSSMAREIAAELQYKEPHRRVRMAIGKGLECIGDPSLLRVVLANLLGNAWKYTGKQDKAIIRFDTAKIDGKPVFFVRDNGAGFEMDAVDKLFIPFQRLHSSEEFSGNGIGLATVERIVKRHGGRVWAEGAPGEGATFFFSIA